MEEINRGIRTRRFRRKWAAVLLSAVCMAACGCGTLFRPAPSGGTVSPRGEQLRQVSLVYEKGRTELARQLRIAQEKKENFTDLIASMTIEQKLAQRMILTNRADMEGQAFRDYMPGGVILFAGDFEGRTSAQVREYVAGLQKGMGVPLLVGVDEEGGSVSRVRGLAGSQVPVFQGARKLFEKGGGSLVRRDAIDKSFFLQEMGINVNFAPVADVVKSAASYMYARSASGDPREASEYVQAVVSGMRAAGMGCCLKHFPGYGENVNTHTTFAVDHKTLREYEEGDFLPFQAGIDAGADMVMVSHIVMEQTDSGIPASLSVPVHRLLRGQFGFDGVIICDDLAMQAIRRTMSMEEAAASALAAGNDMIFAENMEDAMRGARTMYERGEMTEKELDDALVRIFKMKRRLGLLE